MFIIWRLRIASAPATVIHHPLMIRNSSSSDILQQQKIGFYSVKIVEIFLGILQSISTSSIMIFFLLIVLLHFSGGSASPNGYYDGNEKGILKSQECRLHISYLFFGNIWLHSIGSNQSARMSHLAAPFSSESATAMAGKFQFIIAIPNKRER